MPIDFWWMDAGWYPCDGQLAEDRHLGARPRSASRAACAPISDHAHAEGVKTLVWFEPERVASGTWLAKNHPEWLLGGTLLNLGTPGCAGLADRPRRQAS